MLIGKLYTTKLCDIPLVFRGGYLQVEGYGYPHTGYDFSLHSNPNIKTVVSGRVVFAGWEPTGFGYLVIVQDSQGVFHYKGHLLNVSVSVGQYVNEGDVIGKMGSTGNSTGTHIHYEARLTRYSNSHINPYKYLISNTKPMDTKNGEFIIVEQGWGLSHIARAAQYPDWAQESSWQRIAQLNNRDSWQNFQLYPGMRVRVKFEPAKINKPKVIENEKVDTSKELKSQITKLQQQLQTQKKNLSEIYQQRVDNLLASNDNLKTQKKNINTQLKDTQIEIRENKIELFDLSEFYNEVKIDSGVIEEKMEESQGWLLSKFKGGGNLKRMCRGWIKYNWKVLVVWVILMASKLVKNFNIPMVDDGIEMEVWSAISLILASSVKDLIPKYDRNKDGNIDNQDFKNVPITGTATFEHNILKDLNG